MATSWTISTLPPTSVNIGINPPELQRERVLELLHQTGSTLLKIKLGSPDGIEPDKGAFSAIEQSIPMHQRYTLRVDANGAWSRAD